MLVGANRTVSCLFIDSPALQGLDDLSEDETVVLQAALTSACLRHPFSARVRHWKCDAGTQEKGLSDAH